MTRRRLLVAARDYAAYVRSLAPALWFRMNELAGSTAINQGTLGAAYNGAYTACTLAQAGRLSPGGAVLFDGVNSKLTIPAGSYGASAALSAAFLVKPASAGEAGTGRFLDFGTLSFLDFNGALTSLQMRRDATGIAQSRTSTGLAALTWAWVFGTYDNAGERKARVYKGVGSAVTEYGYSVGPVAATGTLTDHSTTPMIIGNIASQSTTFDGLIDEAMIFSRLLTTAEMLQIVRLTSV